MKSLMFTAFSVALFLLITPKISHSQAKNEPIVAFPGAEGFGKYATGGRGGQVAEVTNLNDSGPGSFRDALKMHPGEPLTVVFKVSGIIELKSVIKVSRSNLTIAGQTAPGEGICLKGNSFILNGGGRNGNIIIRYLRSRPGSNLPNGVYGFDMENMSKIIIDHCSFSWANEECAAMYDIKNVTVQWCIVSEGLYNAGHHKGLRSYGGVWGGQNVTYHHNLISNQNSRTVRFNGARAHDTLAVIDYRNNVIYNWGRSNACYGGEVKIPNGRSEINMVSNYYKAGPATSKNEQLFCEAEFFAGSPSRVGQWYMAGNIMEGNATLTKSNAAGLGTSKIPDTLRKSLLVNDPFKVESINTQTAADAYLSVLNKVGAILPVRDAMDNRLINEVRTNKPTGTGSFGKPGIIDDPKAVGGWPVYAAATPLHDSDHDGMPDAWETANGLDKNNADDRNKLNNQGYTMLEVYLNQLK